MNLIIRFFVSGLILLGIDWLLESVNIDSYPAALKAVLILWLMNLLVKPLLHLISLPVTILTFGLFSFIINAFTFHLTSFLVSGFRISSFWGALAGSILLGLILSLLDKHFQSPHKR